MRFRWSRIAIVTTGAAAVGFGRFRTDVRPPMKANARSSPRPSPAYPELARRMNVSGKVKIEVIITPDGHVRSTRVIGGHPLLVQACQDCSQGMEVLSSCRKKPRKSWNSIFMVPTNEADGITDFFARTRAWVGEAEGFCNEYRQETLCGVWPGLGHSRRAVPGEHLRSVAERYARARIRRPRWTACAPSNPFGCRSCSIA